MVAGKIGGGGGRTTNRYAACARSGPPFFGPGQGKEFAGEGKESGNLEGPLHQAARRLSLSRPILAAPMNGRGKHVGGEWGGGARSHPPPPTPDFVLGEAEHPAFSRDSLLVGGAIGPGRREATAGKEGAARAPVVYVLPRPYWGAGGPRAKAAGR